MNNNEIMVSIIVPTYNHEKYIEQAITSILQQKVNFNFEVLIGEDASKDNTENILREMEKNLPSNYYIFYRKENFGAKKNLKDLYDRSLGKYMIILEGDDYWIYNLKLQKQVDFLESHLDYIAIAHNTLVVDKDGKPRNDYIYPECKKEEYTLYDFQDFILMGQTTTILHRNFYKNHIFDDISININYPGDQRKNFLLACHGKIKVVQEKWSAYRYVEDEGSSYSARVKFDKDMPKKDLIFLKTLMNYAFDRVQNINAMKAAETKYLYVALAHCLKNKILDYNITDWCREFLKSKYKLHFLVFLFNRIQRKILLMIKK